MVKVNDIIEGSYPIEWADFCNKNNKMIKILDYVEREFEEEYTENTTDKDGNPAEITKTRKIKKEIPRYQIVDIPEESEEEKKEKVKQIRNYMLENVEWRVARAREQRELGIKTVDNYYNLIHYKQYLRDYPDKVENWWEQNPLEFEEWEKQYEYRQES